MGGVDWWLGVWVLAHIISGEAGTCGLEGRVLVAQVHANRLDAGIVGGWYGSAPPTPRDLAVAMWGREWPANGRRPTFLMSYQDLELERVQRLTHGLEEVARIDCARGTGLSAWAAPMKKPPGEGAVGGG